MAPRVFPAEAKKHLSKYQYNTEDNSALTKYILNPFYNVILRCIPLWMAPNLITLIGFIPVCVMYGVSVYYCPSLKGEAPRWTYLANAFALFFYMLMDNLDGKQARRTNSSSPLGQIFDHGIDALNATIGALTLCATIQTGSTILTMCILAEAFTPFILSTWEEYHTNKLLLRHLNGPTEGIILVIVIYIVSYLKGPSFWVKDFQDVFGLALGDMLPPLKMNEAVAAFGAISVAVSIVVTLINVVDSIALKRGNLKEAFSQLMPFVFTFWAPWYLCRLNKNALILFPQHLCLLTGFIFAQNNVKLLLAHLCRTDYQASDRLYIGWVILTFNQLLGELIEGGPLLVAYTYFAGFSYVFFMNKVITAMADLFNVNCFLIPYPPPSLSPVEVLAKKLEEEDKKQRELKEATAVENTATANANNASPARSRSAQRRRAD